jgi:hypothetical protein
MIAIAIRDEQFIRLRMNPHIGGPVKILRIGVAFALIALSDLHDELAVLRQFQKLIVGNGLHAGQSIRRTRISTKPHISFLCNGTKMRIAYQAKQSISPAGNAEV